MAAAGATAQNFEGSTLEERIAHTMGNNEDSIKTAKGFITMFQQSNSNKDYKDMYVNYQWLKKNAPFAVNGIYTQGPFMFYNLIFNSKFFQSVIYALFLIFHKKIMAGVSRGGMKG